MKTLLEIAYEIGRHWSRKFTIQTHALEALEQACPGFMKEEYQDAYERVLHLTELAHQFANDWYNHKVADLEGLERLEQQCPGFTPLIYRQMWGSAKILNR